MLNIDGLRICPRDAGIILPALEAVERDVGAWIREVRAHVLQSRAAQPSTRLCGNLAALAAPRGSPAPWRHEKRRPARAGVNFTDQFR
jgi:hypothetical protein